ncbi:uncharacterized protein [Triticum aestivum]|uniref:uncharacterized protein n=1 Tax=Triticum aestivum TaxID=4565 RepID=UPI001D01F8D3|nr:uncharacterized protein LOC123117310 [Triticum aestivum]
MASSELPPSKKKSSPTTISSLGEDLLCEVFLRLPSLPTLVRAALTCPAFLRAVRSSPKFRRRFRDLHPAPFLGVFLDIYDPGMPAFAPIRRLSDPDHAAAVRGADVFLTRVPDLEAEEEGGAEDEGEGEGEDVDENIGWSMTECRDGYVVLINRTFGRIIKRVAVYDPLTRGLHLLPAPPGEPEESEVEFHVVTSDEDRRSLRVVCVCKEESGKVRVGVFSPDSREWHISPTGARLQLQDDDSGTLVNGYVYWASVSEAAIHLLNTATLQFSRMDLPRRMQRVGLKVGETSYGKLCLACASELTLDVWVRRADDNGVDKWTFELLDDIDKLRLQFVDHYPRATTEGCGHHRWHCVFVYLPGRAS